MRWRYLRHLAILPTSANHPCILYRRLLRARPRASPDATRQLNASKTDTFLNERAYQHTLETPNAPAARAGILAATRCAAYVTAARAGRRAALCRLYITLPRRTPPRTRATPTCPRLPSAHRTHATTRALDETLPRMPLHAPHLERFWRGTRCHHWRRPPLPAGSSAWRQASPRWRTIFFRRSAPGKPRAGHCHLPAPPTPSYGVRGQGVVAYSSRAPRVVGSTPRAAPTPPTTPTDSSGAWFRARRCTGAATLHYRYYYRIIFYAGYCPSIPTFCSAPPSTHYTALYADCLRCRMPPQRIPPYAHMRVAALRTTRRMATWAYFAPAWHKQHAVRAPSNAGTRATDARPTPLRSAAGSFLYITQRVVGGDGRRRAVRACNACCCSSPATTVADVCGSAPCGIAAADACAPAPIASPPLLTAASLHAPLLRATAAHAPPRSLQHAIHGTPAIAHTLPPAHNCWFKT